jgi:choloylglycine hydrolase
MLLHLNKYKNNEEYMRCRLLMTSITFAVVSACCACTGISLTALDGTRVHARTIEWARGVLKSEYVVVPRGQRLVSTTPDGADGLTFSAKYGFVGLSVVRKDYVAEGINEKGLSAGLFFFPRYGSYSSYDPAQRQRTIADLQLVGWMLANFSNIDEVKAAVDSVRIVSVETESVVHWRIGEPSGREVVLEIVGGEARFYDNPVGVLTNSPEFPWHLTNLSNYVNLRPGDVSSQDIGKLTLRPIGGNSGFLGIPGDDTSPSRFVRAAFYRATAPHRSSAFATVEQSFHLLNAFDIPIGIEHHLGESPDIPSTTQWTSSIDLTNRIVYYKTAYDNSIRSISLVDIDFSKVDYLSSPLDSLQTQPVVKVNVYNGATK